MNTEQEQKEETEQKPYSLDSESSYKEEPPKPDPSKPHSFLIRPGDGRCFICGQKKSKLIHRQKVKKPFAPLTEVNARYYVDAKGCYRRKEAQS